MNVWRSEDNLQESVLSFYYVGSREGTVVTRLGNRYIYLMNESHQLHSALKHMYGMRYISNGLYCSKGRSAVSLSCIIKYLRHLLTFALDCLLFFSWMKSVSTLSASSSFLLFLLNAAKLNPTKEKSKNSTWELLEQEGKWDYPDESSQKEKKKKKALNTVELLILNYFQCILIKLENKKLSSEGTQSPGAPGDPWPFQCIGIREDILEQNTN